MLSPYHITDGLWKNIRYSLRMLAKSPGFTAIAILTLALGIGANTAIFTVANALLLRPLPYRDPARLVPVFFGDRGVSRRGVQFDRPCRADQITAERVSWNFFEVLGVRLVAGRTFEPEEDQPGGRQVVLISAELATRLFKNARDAIGQNLSLDSKDDTVIGVLPTKFSIPLLGRPVDIFAPRLIGLSIVTPARIQIGGMYFEGIARLKPGVRAEQAQLAARSPTCLIESLAPTRRPPVMQPQSRSSQETDNRRQGRAGVYRGEQPYCEDSPRGSPDTGGTPLSRIDTTLRRRPSGTPGPR